MTTVKTVGAVSRTKLAWAAIDGQTARRNVRRLQVRIVQATKEGLAFDNLIWPTFDTFIWPTPGS